MNDALWHTTQQTRTLQNYQDEIQGIWDDQNAREMHTRYLAPHRSDSDDMLHFFQQQERSIELAQEHLKAAEIALAQARSAQSDILSHIHRTEEEMRTSTHEYELFAQYNNKALASLPQIFELIASAYKAGSENNPYSDFLPQFQRLISDNKYRFNTNIDPLNDALLTIQK